MLCDGHRRFPGLRSLLALLAAVASISCGGGAGVETIPAGPPAPGLSLLAGNVGGPGYIDAVGTDARFGFAGPLAADAAGNVYVADLHLNNLVRRIAPDGTVTTLAGKKGSVTGLLDGKGADARFRLMAGIAADRAGNVYLIDAVNDAASRSAVIRRITPDGVVTTVPNSEQVLFFRQVGAGRGGTVFATPSIIAVDDAGTIYTVGNTTAGNDKVWRLGAAGEATELAEQAGPLAVDAGGNLYILHSADHAIRKRTPEGVVSTVVTDPVLEAAVQLALGPDDRTMYVSVGCAVLKADAVTGVATPLAGNPQMCGSVDGEGALARLPAAPMTADSEGNVFVSDALSVRKITPKGSVFTLAGGGPLVRGYADGVGAAARFRSPTDVAPDARGNLYVADPGAAVIRRIDPAGRATTLAGKDSQPGNDDGRGTQATFQEPRFLTVGPSGAVHVLQSNNRIRKVTPDGVVTTTILPTSDPTGCRGGLVADAQENLYVSCVVLIKVAPTGVISAPWNPGLDLGPGGPLGGASDSVRAAANPIYHPPEGLAIDADGNLYGFRGQDPILRFLQDGRVESIAGTGSTLFRRGIAVDPAGNIYLSESASSAELTPAGGDVQTGFIRKISPAGEVATIAGSEALAGTMLGPLPGALDGPRGLRFIAPKTLAVAMPAGVVKLVAP